MSRRAKDPDGLDRHEVTLGDGGWALIEGRETLWEPEDDDRADEVEAFEETDEAESWRSAAWAEYRGLFQAVHRGDLWSSSIAVAFDPKVGEVADAERRLAKLTYVLTHWAGARGWEQAPAEWGDWWGLGLPPAGWEPAPADDSIAARSSEAAARPVKLDDKLALELTADERRHLQWLLAGWTQRRIQGELGGISQPAVHKREVRLRKRVDEIAIRTIGRPYPWLRRTTPRGGHPRRS